MSNDAPITTAYTMHPKMRRRLRSYALRTAARRWLGRWVRRLWTPKSAPTDKLLVILSDGRCALADNDDHAQALVMNECLRSGGVISANFRPATADEVAALSSPNTDSSK